MGVQLDRKTCGFFLDLGKGGCLSLDTSFIHTQLGTNIRSSTYTCSWCIIIYFRHNYRVLSVVT